LKYTIVIPTRNRAAYLRHTLETCLAAAPADCEVIVSDNSDSDQSAAVAEVVRVAKSSAVRHVRPDDVPLGMSAHWEFALSQLRGEYVVVIGDDDALLPSTFAALDHVLAATSARIVSWPRIDYCWPDHVTPEQRDRVIIPLVDDRLKYEVARVDGHRELRRVMRRPEQYSTLPVLYHSAVHRSAVELLLQPPAPYIRGCAPDIYSGIVFACLVRDYIRLRTPLSVSGASGMSNGTAYYRVGRRSQVVNDFAHQNRRSNIRCHASVPDVPVLSALFAESFAKVKERYANETAGHSLDADWYARRIVRDVARLPWGADDRAAIVADVLDHYGRRPALVRLAERESPVADDQSAWRPGFRESRLYVDGRAFGAGNVADAARLSDAVLSYDVARFADPARGHPLKERIAQLVPPLLWEKLKLLKQAYG